MTSWSLRSRLVAVTVIAVAAGFVTGAALVAALASVEDSPIEQRREVRVADERRDPGILQAMARRRVVLGGAVAAATAGAVAWGLAGAALAPLERLRAGAAEVAATSDLTRRVPAGTGPEEVDVLARTVNEMLSRLQSAEASTRDALDASRAFAAGAAHELRTPLTSIQVDLETLANPTLDAGTRDEILVQARAEHARLVVLLDQLLALARGDAGITDAESVDVGDLLEVAAQALRRRSPEATVQVSSADGLVVAGSPEGLRLAVDNLLDNAVRHGGGAITLRTVVADEPDGWIIVQVDDEGPGIPADDRLRVQGRFERGAAATTPGSGLGLALVAQQAALHGGRLDLNESEAGGLRADLWLPTATESQQ